MASTGTTGDTLASMNGIVKEVYAKEIENAVPAVAKLLKEFPFSERTAVGNLYHQPVILQNEVGFTYDAGNDTNLIGYNPVLPMQMKDAQVSPTQLLLRSRIGYEVMQRAKSGGTKAFQAATLLLVKNMVDSMAVRLEMSCLYGGSGLGTINAISLAANTPVTGTTTATITVTASQWAIGLWQGQETSALDFFTAAGTTPINTAASVPTAGYPQLVTVNPPAKQLTVTLLAADATALQTAVTANVDSVRIFWGGSFGNEMVGLKTILSNAGTLFNINAGAYDLWRGNVVNAGGTSLTQALIQQTVAVCAARGLQEEELLLIVSNEGWADLMTSQAALRMYDQSYSAKKFENGAKQLSFNSQNGSIRVMAHPMVKDGDAFLIPTAQCERIGACEPTFEQPGYESRLPFVPLENFPGMQIVRYSSQQIFLKTPARAAYIFGIVNVSSAT